MPDKEKPAYVHEMCDHCGSEPEDSTRCVYCGKPGPGVTMIPTYREQVEAITKITAPRRRG